MCTWHNPLLLTQLNLSGEENTLHGLYWFVGHTGCWGSRLPSCSHMPTYFSGWNATPCGSHMVGGQCIKALGTWGNRSWELREARRVNAELSRLPVSKKGTDLKLHVTDSWLHMTWTAWSILYCLYHLQDNHASNACPRNHNHPQLWMAIQLPETALHPHQSPTNQMHTCTMSAEVWCWYNTSRTGARVLRATTCSSKECYDTHPWIAYPNNAVQGGGCSTFPHWQGM